MSRVAYIENLTKKIQSQIGWVINDSLTFLWLRNSKYQTLGRIVLGGGNLMMANSAFSALNYISKVNFILRTNPTSFDEFNPFVTNKGKEQSNIYFKTLKQQNVVTPKNEWQINESLAFRYLIEDLLKETIDLGLEVKDSENEWKKYRNYMSHMNYPKGVILTDFNKIPEKIVLGIGGKKALYKELDKLQQQSFLKFYNHLGQYIYAVYVDILIFRDLIKIQDYLTRKIKQAKMENLNALNDWNSS